MIYLKLKSPRRRDAADAVDLLAVTSDPDEVRSYIAANAPGLLGKLDVLAAEAREDE